MPSAETILGTRKGTYNFGRRGGVLEAIPPTSTSVPALQLGLMIDPLTAEIGEALKKFKPIFQPAWPRAHGNLDKGAA